MTRPVPANPDDAVDAWHQALARGSRARESAEWLEAEQARRGLAFGDRALCHVLRPRFLSRGQYDLLRTECRLLLSAFAKVFAAALADPAVLDRFRLTDWERDLLGRDPAAGPPSALARIDAFFDQPGSDFWVTELNGETPAGAGFTDALTEIFLDMPVTRDVLRDFVLWTLPVRHRVLQTLLGAWEAFPSGGRGRTPALAIVDWHDVPTRSEFLVFRDYFTLRGFTCLIADPEELEYRDGTLTARGTPVNLIYKRILLHELVDRAGADHPLLRAVTDGAVCMVNGVRCKVLHKKASLAVLHDDRHAGLFSADELAAIRRRIPWTRVVEDGPTSYQDGRVDLLPFLAGRRERMVLKPNDDYGGSGIVLGWQVDQSTWEAALRIALDRPSIVQERVTLPTRPFPGLVDGGLVLHDRIVDTAPFAFEGAVVDGCLTRISTHDLVNVTAGGGSTVPTFVVEPRRP